MSLTTTLTFLTQLAQNNDRTWFAEHRAEYDAARAAFEALCADIIARFDPIEDLGPTTVKDCLFRIHRDVRFSKDKSPYSTHMSAAFARGGRNANARSYYLQVGPNGLSFIGGGLYNPSSAQLAAVRTALAINDQPLRRILADTDYVRVFGPLQGETLKKAPSGYSPDHPAIDLLRYKQYLAIHPIADTTVTGPNFAGYVLNVFRIMQPFVAYIHEHSTGGQ